MKMDGFLTLSFSFLFLSSFFVLPLAWKFYVPCACNFFVSQQNFAFSLYLSFNTHPLSKVTNCFSLHSLVDSKCIPTQKRTYRILTLYILPGRWFFCSATKQNSIKEENEANQGAEKWWNTFSKRIFTHPGFEGKTNRQENRFCSWWSYFPAWTTGGEGCQSR